MSFAICSRSVALCWRVTVPLGRSNVHREGLISESITLAATFRTNFEELGI